jgi:hypothetical protein
MVVVAAVAAAVVAALTVVRKVAAAVVEASVLTVAVVVMAVPVVVVPAAKVTATAWLRVPARLAAPTLLVALPPMTRCLGVRCAGPLTAPRRTRL